MFTLSRIASLGAAAKIGIGVSVAAATVAATGAAGMLPAGASHGVRHAIETVTPVKFHESHDSHGDRDHHGSRVSADARGDSDGDNGVDGRTVSDEAPGAAHRSTDSARPDQPPGQTGITGQARADQTPAATHGPDSLSRGRSATAPNGDHTQGQIQS